MATVPIITEEMLTDLRGALAGQMGEKRYRHTLGVERMIARLGELYLPDRIPALRAAALLHDITKELSTEEQVALCRTYGIPYSKADLLSPKLFHARTGACRARDVYPAYVDDEIFDAIRKHTTGAREMSLFAKLLYLADYIEDTRTYPNCVTLRLLFFEMPDGMTHGEQLRHLDKILVLSYDMTIRDLLEEESPIAPDTVDARNALLEEINGYC